MSAVTALNEAIGSAKIHLAKFVIDATDENIVNSVDINGKSPIMHACYVLDEKGRYEAVELLLRKGADVNQRDNRGRSVLSYAAELHCSAVMQLLLTTNDIHPNLADTEGNTPLMYCAMSGNVSGLRLLIRSFRKLGVLDVDARNRNGYTALLLAAKSGHIECANVLVADAKACPRLRDPDCDYSPADWARKAGCHTPEMNMLLDERATTDLVVPHRAQTATTFSNFPQEVYTRRDHEHYTHAFYEAGVCQRPVSLVDSQQQNNYSSSSHGRRTFLVAKRRGTRLAVVARDASPSKTMRLDTASRRSGFFPPIVSGTQRLRPHPPPSRIPVLPSIRSPRKDHAQLVKIESPTEPLSEQDFDHESIDEQTGNIPIVETKTNSQQTSNTPLEVSLGSLAIIP